MGPVAPAVGASRAVPQHVAIIMDGNRRWARARGLPASDGHRFGGEAVRRAVNASVALGLRCLTVFAFSVENWGRAAAEVDELRRLVGEYIQAEIEDLHARGIRIRVIGARARFDPDIVDRLAEAEERTRGNPGLLLTIALDYGARQEIVAAAASLARAATDGRLRPEDLDEACFAAALQTAGLPDPDLLIRTSGEQRLSNFLLWQLAYTELVFLDVLWPDFEAAHLQAALEEYARRERRYGTDAG